jgi:hypothetical protein
MKTLARSLPAVVISILFAAPALAQPAEPEPAQEETPPPTATPFSPAPPMLPPGEQPPPEEDPEKKKEPGKGDFDAGGQARFPNGPDEMGEFATFNWVAVDLEGRYFLLDGITLNGSAPLAVKKPSDLEMGAVDPRLIGGMHVRLDAKLPNKGFAFYKPNPKNEVGLTLGVAYMREGAMLLSEKDYPLFTGSFKPGVTGGLIMKTALGNVVDFSLVPIWVFQTGEEENLTGVQIPMALILKVGSVAKLSVDLAVNTGDDYTFRSSKGGRVSTGVALDLKIGPILAHAGAGFASLGTGESSMYPTIGDSMYVDINAKFAK